MRALSIRQPYAELILRGVKTVEYRSRATRIVGERFYLYAAGRKWDGAERARVWSRDLAAAGRGEPGGPPWMAELANALRLFPHDLPTGVIVGTAVIERCEEVRVRGPEVGGQELETRSQEPDAGLRLTSDLRPLSPGDGLRPLASLFHWHLIDVKRLDRPRKPEGRPQPVWFKPF